jgi:salicylate hydroxylase
MHATRAELLAEFGVFHPQFLHLLRLADEPLLLWQLRALPQLPTWTNGCVALLDDAAHATFPTLGQGAAMALEDAVTLGILFPHGTAPVNVPARLGAYEALRKERAEFIGRESFEQFMLPEKKNLLSRCEFEGT